MSPSSLHQYLLSKVIPGTVGEKCPHGVKLGEILTNLSIVSIATPSNLDTTTSTSSFSTATSNDHGGMAGISGGPGSSSNNNNNTNTGSLNGGITDPKFKEKIIISGLMNEHQMIKFNETNRLNKQSVQQQGVFKDNKSFLHNAIILANKHFNSTVILPNTADNRPFSLYSLQKRKLISDSPIKYADLIQGYVCLPGASEGWLLLCLTLKEFLFETESLINDKNFVAKDKPVVEFDFGRFLGVDLLDGQSQNQSQSQCQGSHGGGPGKILAVEAVNTTLYNSIHQYITMPFTHNFIINNNLGITTLPILLISLLHLNNNTQPQIQKSMLAELNLPLNQLVFVEFIIGNFLVLFRLLNFFKRKFFLNLPLPAESNWNLRGTYAGGTNSNTNRKSGSKSKSKRSGSGSGSMYDVHESGAETQDEKEEEESIIMGVIFYLINELGCQYDQSIFSDYELEQLNLQNYRTFGSVITMRRSES
ncbi:unnamed protein product [Ambrosiozyma monospora]|uniref:Unnamed protein product n=1 Tax=Ambrosiozyma monospora TaxID=43982 RepID=A0ACB5U162_AMBMO|nr:unnamed protein product [Ambrosiozyma monospora]